MAIKTMNTNKNLAVVDLFCGVGGLTQGFVKAKFDVRAGLDFDSSCKYAYERNNSTNSFMRTLQNIHLRKLPIFTLTIQ